MTKLPGRIPSQSVSQSSGWSLPEIESSNGSKTICLKSSDRVGKLDKAALPQRAKTSQPALKKGAGSGIEDSAQAPVVPQDRGAIVEEVKAAPVILTEDQGYSEGLEKGQAEGYKKGEQEGYQVGLEAGTKSGAESGAEAALIDVKAAFDQEVAAQRETLAGLIRAFSEPPKYEVGLDNALVDLVTELTKVIVAGEVKSHPEHVKNLVTTALQALPHNTKAPRVFVNPSDLKWLEESVHPDVVLVADAALARGGCRVESSASQLEATIAERIRHALVAACVTDDVSEIEESDMQKINEDLDA